MNGIYLGLGTNMGNKSANLNNALHLISTNIGPVLKKSSIVETEAWGKTDQPNFFNMVIQINTTLSPKQLLDKCQYIEKKLGRIRTEKWGPRVIDIDILYYHNEVVNEEKLIIPHPYIKERDFVLEPLNEILEDRMT